MEELINYWKEKLEGNLDVQERKMIEKTLLRLITYPHVLEHHIQMLTPSIELTIDPEMTKASITDIMVSELRERLKDYVTVKEVDADGYLHLCKSLKASIGFVVIDEDADRKRVEEFKDVFSCLEVGRYDID